MDLLSYIWLGAVVFFLIVEATTVTMVSAWFVVGSVAALAANQIGLGLWPQIILFLVVSGLCLLLLRPLAKKHLNNKTVKTNVEAVSGKTGLVTQAIDNVKAQGTVQLESMSWSARSTSGEPIPEGTLVRADRVEGVKVYVTPVGKS